MGLTFIASSTYYSSSTAGTTGDGGTVLNVQSGDILIAGYRTNIGDISDLVIDENDGTDSFTSLGDQYDYALSMSFKAAYLIVAGNDASFTPRATHAASLTYRMLIVLQFRPDAGETISIDNVLANAQGNDANPLSSLINTTGDDEVVVNFLCFPNATYTPSAWTINGSAVDGNIAQNQRFRAGYELLTTPTNNVRGDATIGGALQWISSIVSFKSSVSGYTLTYDGNGNTGGTVPTDGSSPYAESAEVIVLGNSGSLVKTGYTWTGWNTAADGGGTHYDETDTFNMPASNTILYAEWTENVPPSYPTKIIVVGGQGDRSGMSDNNGGAYSSGVSYSNFQDANGGPLYSVTGCAYDTATGWVTKTGLFGIGSKYCWALITEGGAGAWLRNRYYIQDADDDKILIGIGLGSNSDLDVVVGGALATYTEAETASASGGDSIVNKIPNGNYVTANGVTVTLDNPAASGGGTGSFVSINGGLINAI